MSFRWWKRLSPKPVSESRLPIKVRIEPVQDTASPDSGEYAVGASGKRMLDQLSVTPERYQGRSGYEESNPFGRCGFSTGIHERTQPSECEMIAERLSAILQDEHLRNRIRDSDSLEECLQIIGEVSERPKVTVRREEPACGEENDPDCHGDFSLWGKRIPGQGS
jgi:hypothetical protein